MKKMVSFIMLYVFVGIFLGSGASYSKIEYYDSVRTEHNIIEQGIKVQYKDDISPQELKEFLGITGELKIYGKNIAYKHNDEKFLIELKYIDSFVELEIILKDNKTDIEELEKIFKDKFKDKKNLDIFTYIKGKVNDNHNLKSINLEGNYNVKSIENLEIDNGYTGVITLKNNEQLNYAIKNYGKDDNYIIVGSPVIFISY
ncbi:hypothetical protein [uncultured Clostridium sp.]|uniref:hypothetical protein n=1 Tax=uncultured Clostridium sp. TaxID=59620 RepID=UPI002608379C|nr:hypothetical protein [uncultured Clostridium sp.]